MPRVAKQKMSNMRRFLLIRKEDVSGTSGTGVVAEGIQFSNGQIAMHWTTQFQSVAVFDNLATVEAIHGHEGKTSVMWVDK